MIRSRDLTIFLTILFMLGIGIVYTVAKDIGLGRSTTIHNPSFNTASDTSMAFSAVDSLKSIDRQQNIDNLRQALKDNTTLVKPSPSVEEPTSSAETATSSKPTSGIQSCDGTDDALEYIHNWPVSDISIREEQGLRIVSYVASSSVISSAAGASTTADTAIAPLTLLEMPLSPQMSAKPHCVPSDAIGVAQTGSLMSNSDATFYKGYGPDYLIGYARDGYPIYGTYQGTVDACGGYMSSTGYRYTVSPDRNYIIGCFVAEPSPFVGL